MSITEPMTMITDYVLGAFALVLAARLMREGMGSGQVSVKLWAVAFLMTAIAAVVGGTFHGFIRMVPSDAGRAMWKMTLLATGIGSACLLASAVLAGTTGTLQRALIVLVVAKLAVYVWLIASRDQFFVVIADYGIALVLVLILAWIARGSGLAPAAGWIAAGVAVSVVAGAVQALKLAPHPGFNHNDLFHVIQMVALYLLFRGGLLLRDRV